MSAAARRARKWLRMISTCRPVHASTRQPGRQSVHLSGCLPVFLTVCLTACLTACLTVLMTAHAAHATGPEPAMHQPQAVSQIVPQTIPRPGAPAGGPTEAPGTANATPEAVAQSVADSKVQTLANAIAARGVQDGRHLVLLLHSYEQGMGRVRELTDTVERMLAPVDNHIALRVENLDSKRVHTPEYLDAFAALLALKYARRPPTLILTSDDDALDFLETHHAALFPGVPVLFCGVNHFQDGLATSIPRLSGVLSTFSARETALTMLDMHPGTRQIYLVNDHTEIGQAVARDVRGQLANLPGGVQVHEFPPLPFDDLLSRLATLPPDAAVLLGVYFVDSVGYATTFEDMGARISAAARVPVHCLVDLNLNGAVVGGKVSGATLQAEALGRMALRVISGTRAEDIPIQKEGVNRYVYRAPALERWGIAEGRLPSGSTVIDHPFSLYRTYRPQINVLILFVVSLASTIAVLAYMMRRRAASERQLRRLRNLLANTLDSMPSAIVGVSPEGLVTHWNRRAADATGQEPHEAVGRPLGEVFPRLEKLTPLVFEALKDGQVRDGQRLLRPDGDMVRYEDVTVFPLVANGTQGAVIRVDDVTERERIREMMIQTEKMLTVGGLAAGMAHEINNPLGGILQAVQNMRRRVETGRPVNDTAAREAGLTMEQVRGYLERREILRMLDDIAASGARAAHIVANMLDFSRRTDGEFMPQDLHRLIENTLELAANDYDLKKLYDFRTLRVVRHYSPMLPQVPCLATEVEQVLLNLFKNAAQALAAGPPPDGAPPTLTIRTERHHDLVAVTVSDNGPGMTPEVRARVFDPFYTTKPPGEGTGLGLSVSYFLITHNHGGSFALHSEPGKGAHFTFTLPLRQR
uniref:histidine kinase n=1 Tax=Nitratidesulfovibrio vulgaris (strain DSM 19637 / Miyazaki F) TaxID=883 RepID=B8DK81_NITV9